MRLLEQKHVRFTIDPFRIFTDGSDSHAMDAGSDTAEGLTSTPSTNYRGGAFSNRRKF